MTEREANADRSRAGERGPILVAVDFTPDSEAALYWACEFAECVGAAVKVLHVVHDPEDAPGSYRLKGHDALRPLDDVAGEMMAEFLEKAKGGEPDLRAISVAEPVIVKGIPASRILEVAERERARMIVMGSRGRTGLPHLLLGSKAERVVQLSAIPVTIVKAKAKDD